MFVIPNTKATSDPAPDPLPGPTGTLFSLAQEINSCTSKVRYLGINDSYHHG